MQQLKRQLQKMLIGSEMLSRRTQDAESRLEDARVKFHDEAVKTAEANRAKALTDPAARRKYQAAVFHRGMMAAAGDEQ